MERLFLILLMLLVTLNLGCSSLWVKDPATGLVVSGISVASKSREEVKILQPTAPGSECEFEARTFLFLTGLPGLNEVHRFNQYLARKFPNPSEPQYIAGCVVNPYKQNQKNFKKTQDIGAL